MNKAKKKRKFDPKDAFCFHQRKGESGIHPDNVIDFLEFGVEIDKNILNNNSREVNWEQNTRKSMNGNSFSPKDRLEDWRNKNQRFNHQTNNYVNPDKGGWETIARRVFIEKSEIGKTGLPYLEQYTSTAIRSSDSGNFMSERQQIYHNLHTGLHKTAHERLINNQGRKIVKEKIYDNNLTEYDHYKNIYPENGRAFDNKWSKMSDNIGFESKTSENALPYAQTDYYKKPIVYRNGIYKDYAKGYFMDDKYKMPESPVVLRKNPLQYEDERKAYAKYAKNTGIRETSEMIPERLGEDPEAPPRRVRRTEQRVNTNWPLGRPNSHPQRLGQRNQQNNVVITPPQATVDIPPVSSGIPARIG